MKRKYPKEYTLGESIRSHTSIQSNTKLATIYHRAKWIRATGYVINDDDDVGGDGHLLMMEGMMIMLMLLTMMMMV